VPYVVAALVLVGGLALLNLLLTYGLIRRLREQAAMLTDLMGGLAAAPPGDLARPVGSPVEQFRTEAVDGTAIDTAWFDRPTLVGFFSPGCEPCAALVPRFAAAAATTRALAVIEPGPVDDSEYRTALGVHATVVAGEPARAVVEAFGVVGYPTACLVDLVDAEAVITATGTNLVDAAVRGDSRSARV
jgi:thiol-disulfide isomerase/thioredoxin